MTYKLDLADIQGGILRAYGRQGFPKARYFFLTVKDAAKGRHFVMALRPRITTASRWENPNRGAPLLRGSHPRMVDVLRAEAIDDYPGVVRLEKPQVAINIAFTFLGLLALETPIRTLRGMPDEFIEGMAARASLLGDTPFLDKRDAIWRNADVAPIHIMVSMNAEMNPDGTPVQALLDDTAWLQGLCAASDGGVELLSGNGPTNAAWQEMSAVLVEQDGVMQPTNKEHFGLSDGFGDPVFEGQYSGPAEKLRVIGQGKLTGAQAWEPLATGEFLLGHPDEAQEVPGAAMPIDFSRNGVFMAYRKLHENVSAFDDYIAAQAQTYASVMGLTDLNEAADTLKAKIVGRWPDGVPLMAAPTYADWLAFQARLKEATEKDDKVELAKIALEYVNFKYRPDPDGTMCPVTSHLRRANTRDMLDPYFSSTNPKAWEGSVLNNRRRILRRGLPYGAVSNPPKDTDEQGIIFLAVCASLFRQFEFLQQQWIQYGLDFNAGNDTCPLLGNHGPDAGQMQDAKFVIAADPASGKPPYICPKLPQLVEPRGGEYFFVPSMTALQMIGMGIVDPT
jgi:deferrochelatase/peroxidase EfeB